MKTKGAKRPSEAAAHFINNFVRPILGAVHTPKVHKLLRHILAAIRLHGNLQNGNISTNEAGHKTDKRFYGRTNKAIYTFTAQIAQQSQGAQAMLSKMAVIDAETIKHDKLRCARRARAHGGKVTANGTRSVRGVPLIAVGALALRPGLGLLATVLGLSLNVKVPVLGEVKLLAELDCGTRLPQLLRSSMDYRRRGA